MPCVLVNPRVPVATKDVFAALGAAQRRICWSASPTCSSAVAWPEEGARSKTGSKRSRPSSNDLEAPANRIQPVIGEVISALNATNGVWLARMSGSGATCFAVYENTAEARPRGGEDQARSPHWWVHAGVLS